MPTQKSRMTYDDVMATLPQSRYGRTDQPVGSALFSAQGICYAKEERTQPAGTGRTWGRNLVEVGRRKIYQP